MPTLPQGVIHEDQEPYNGHSVVAASPVCPHCPQAKVTTDLSSPISPSPAERGCSPRDAEMVSTQPVGGSQHIPTSPLYSYCSLLPTLCFLLLKVLLIFPALLQPGFPALGDLSSSHGLTVSLSVNFLLFKIFFQREGWDIAFSHSIPSRAAHPPAQCLPASSRLGGYLATLLVPLRPTLSSLSWQDGE